MKAWRLPAGTDLDPATLDSVGVPLGNRLDEVGAEIQKAVGLDRTQFVQTIVLPQGEFAHFLRAKPEERRGLLQKIFGTEVYERLALRLAEMRRESDRASAAARAALSSGTSQLVGAARLTDDEAADVRAAIDAAVVRGDGLVAAVRSVVAGADRRARRAGPPARAPRRSRPTRSRRAARTHLDEATATDALLRRRDRAAGGAGGAGGRGGHERRGDPAAHRRARRPRPSDRCCSGPSAPRRCSTRPARR